MSVLSIGIMLSGEGDDPDVDESGQAAVEASDDHDAAADDDDAAAVRGDVGEDGDDGGDGGVDGGSLWFGWDDRGRFRFNGELAADGGLVVEAALREAADRLFARTGATTAWPDALRDVAERSLASIEGESRRDSYRVHLHLDVDGALTDQAGRRLPDAICRHLDCDGTLTPVFHQHGHPDRGRSPPSHRATAVGPAGDGA